MSPHPAPPAQPRFNLHEYLWRLTHDTKPTNHPHRRQDDQS